MNNPFIDYINASLSDLDKMIIDNDFAALSLTREGAGRPPVPNPLLEITINLRRAQNDMRQFANSCPDVRMDVLDAVESIKNGRPTWGPTPVPFAAQNAAKQLLQWYVKQLTTPHKYRKTIRRCRLHQCSRFFIPDKTNKLFCCPAHQEAHHKAKDACQQRLRRNPPAAS
jgi:hypothetical protein